MPQIINKKAVSKIELSDDDIRKLKGKKVMMPLKTKYGDFWNGNFSRYEHTMIVVSISERIIKILNLSNADKEIVKSIAKFHDVGHCPFGHAGEECLNSLISEGLLEYRDEFFSGYKHNLLSAKLLLDYINPLSPNWKIIDGITKHCATMPKNFNIDRVQKNNLLKLNYIFRDDLKNKNLFIPSDSWKRYISNFSFSSCSYCKNKIVYYSSEFDFSLNSLNLYLCKKNNKNVVSSQSRNDIDLNVSRYLLVPEPLSLEGSIVKIADEIACLSYDYFLYFAYLKHNCMDKKSNICISRINNLINQLFSYSVNVGNFKGITLLDSLNKLISSPSKNNCNELIKNLIYCLELTNNGKRGCDSLLNFNCYNQYLFNNIKDTIYSLIHNDFYISKDNQTGAKLIQRYFYFLCKKPKRFCSEIGKTKFNSIFEALKTGCNIRTFSKYKKTDFESKLMNVYRREVAFYIATLTEDELIKKSKKCLFFQK